jgi:glycosyltransferase involved in cell wall biosynthesis
MLNHFAVRGSAGGYTGYDSTVRSFLRALARVGVEISLIDFPEWADMPLPPDKADCQWTGSTAVGGAPAIVQFCMPYQVMRYRDRRNINFTMFELDRVPWFWLEHSLLHDHVVVPEVCSRQSWLADGFPSERISICHLGVDSAQFHPGVPAYPLGEVRGRSAATYRVRLLNVSAIQPRKNLLALLRVWLEATRPDDDAFLVVKLSYSGPAAARLMRDFHFLERAIGRTRDQAAPLLLIDPILSDVEMPGLYAAATHYWSMSRGEGWDQPMTEAAASGLRLIAPDHTAYRTYLDRDVATLLPCRQEPASRLDLEEPDPRIYRSFFTRVPHWWEPDRESAIEAIRQAIAGRDAPRGSARERMKEFSWERAAGRLCEIVEQVLVRPGAAI